MADNNIDPELIRELTEKYEQMRDAIASMVPAMVLSTTAINQMIAASKGLAVSEQDGKKVVDEFLNSIKKSTTENEAAAKATKEKNERDAEHKKIDDALHQSLKQFGTALMSTATGMTKYGQSVTTATTAAGDFASNFGIWGKIIGGAIKVLGFFVDAVFKQNDALIKSYDSLSEVGATSALTTGDIRKLGANAGYVGDQLEKFTDITKGLGTNLVALGGSASKGVVEFSKLATVTQAQRDGYNNLGISQELLTKMQGNYVKQTTAAGIALAKSPELLRKESFKYIDALVELAALTGISVQKQQEALDIANADENFNQYKAAQGMKRQALLEQADNEQDQARKKQLISQADAIKATIEQKDAYAKVAVNTMSAANAAAVLQSISTDGATVYTESNAKLLMAGIDIAKHNKEMNAGRSQEVELLEGQVKATRRFTNMFGNGASAYGEASRELQKVFGVDNKMRETAAQFDKLKTEEGKKQFLAQRKINADEIAAKKAGLGPADAVKEAQNEQLKTELALRKAFDELTSQISGPVNNGFKILMQTTMGLAKTFAEISYRIGGPDLRHLFKTPEELKKDVEDLVKQTSELESALAKEVDLRKEKIKNDEAANKKEKEYQDANEKLIEIGKNRPTGKSKEEITAWQTQRIDQAKLVQRLDEERKALEHKGKHMQRQIESGVGTSSIAGQESMRSALEKKRAELAQAKKYATDAGVSTAPPPTAGKPTPAAAPVSPQKLEQRSAAAANLGTTKEGKAINTEDVLAKIRFKDRKENTGGGKADPKLIDIAQKINEAFPGSTITALNDMYHQNRRDRGGNIIKSRHTEGKALDFSLNPAPKDAEEASLISEQLRDLGASKVLDEYFANKSDQSTGGHFHVEVMKDGGVIQAQPGGTLVQAAEAGVNEAFVPLPKGRNIPVSMPSLDKLTKANTLLMDDIKLLVGDNISNSPLVNSITDKLTDKLNPEKLLLTFLTKNISGLGNIMTASNIANTATNSEMSTSEKLLEIAKILNPTVRLVTKLYDTYQAISGDGFNEKPNKEIPNITEINNTKEISKLTEINNTKVEQQAQPSDQELITKLLNATNNIKIPDINGIINTKVEQQGQTSDQELITKLLNATNNIKIPDVNEIINTKVEQQLASQQELITKLLNAKTGDGFSAKSNKDTPDSSGLNNPYGEQQELITKLFNAKTGDGFSAKSNNEIPDVNGIINSRVEQQQASQQELITKLSTAISSTPSGNNDNSSSMNAMVEMLAEKLDSMNNKLETSNSLQDDLLKYSKM